MAQAYFIVGGEEEVGHARGFAERELGVDSKSPDAVILRHLHFSVEDARKLCDIAHASPIGRHKAVIVSATRFFHEAQNALLKLFEEPPLDTTLIIIVPSEGVFLSTLRSRLTPLLIKETTTEQFSELTHAFLKTSSAEREKVIAKLIDRSKSDKDEEKQQARSDAVRLAEDLLRTANAMRKKGKNTDELVSFMDDLTHFLPLLHTRSAPLKLIFEHLSLVIPKGLEKAAV